MTFADLPPTAAWRHEEARDGFEVVRFDGRTARGTTTAVEADAAFVVSYEIVWDQRWRTVRARVDDGSRSIVLEHDGEGAWRVDGEPVPHLAGCSDVDLESSALTNTFPVHRLGLGIGGSAEVPAAYVTRHLVVERLDQTYVRVADGASGQEYDYAAPVFDFSARLAYDPSGLVVTYPGLATRVR